MKKLTLNLLLILLVNISFVSAQRDYPDFTKGKIGITFNPYGDAFVYQDADFIGGPSYDFNSSFNVGFIYLYPITKSLELETGLEYAKFSFKLMPNVSPDSDRQPFDFNHSVFNIPISLRLNFLKYLFIYGGLNLDFDSSFDSRIDSQIGLGPNFGFGLKHDFSSGVSLFFNPYLKLHSLLPFMPSGHHESIWESGFRVGVTYNLGK